MRQATLHIEGMSYGHCLNAVEPALSAVPGHDRRGADRPRPRQLRRHHHYDLRSRNRGGGGRLPGDRAAIERQHDRHEHLALDRATIPVQGMTCAACSARVQRTLERTPGVSGANVNLMTGSATVSYDPASTTPERLVEAIRETGYGAELPERGTSVEELAETEETARDRERREFGLKFGVALLAALLSMALSMPPRPWLLLGLTVPVMGWAGRHFSTRAWAAFRHRSADMNTLIAVGTGAAFAYSLFVTIGGDWLSRRGDPAPSTCIARW